MFRTEYLKQKQQESPQTDLDVDQEVLVASVLSTAFGGFGSKNKENKPQKVMDCNLQEMAKGEKGEKRNKFYISLNKFAGDFAGDFIEQQNNKLFEKYGSHTKQQMAAKQDLDEHNQRIANMCRESKG